MRTRKGRPVSSKIVEYGVVSCEQAQFTASRVQELILDGWQPYGSLAVVHQFEKTLFTQAVVRYETSDRAGTPEQQTERLEDIRSERERHRARQGG